MRTLQTTLAFAAMALVAMTVPGRANEAQFSCDGGTRFVARFSPPNTQPGKVTVRISGGADITLPQVLSADGGRYAEGATELWVKGRGATFTYGGRTMTCRTN